MFLPEVYINLFQGVCIIMFDVGKMIFTRIREKSFLLLSHELVFRSFRFNDTHVQPIYLKYIIQRGDVRNSFLISAILCDFKSLRRQSSEQKQCNSLYFDRDEQKGRICHNKLNVRQIILSFDIPCHSIFSYCGVNLYPLKSC